MLVLILISDLDLQHLIVLIVILALDVERVGVGVVLAAILTLLHDARDFIVPMFFWDARIDWLAISTSARSNVRRLAVFLGLSVLVGLPFRECRAITFEMALFSTPVATSSFAALTFAAPAFSFPFPAFSFAFARPEPIELLLLQMSLRRTGDTLS